MRVVDHSDCEYNTKKQNGYPIYVMAAMDGSVAEPGVCTRACDECMELHYGDPKIGDCKPCNCNELGSESFQCDFRTGKCKCLEG